MSETITIYCKNNNTYKDVPIGSSLLDIYTALGAPLRYRPMNAQVNNKTESLTSVAGNRRISNLSTILNYPD